MKIIGFLGCVMLDSVCVCVRVMVVWLEDAANRAEATRLEVSECELPCFCARIVIDILMVFRVFSILRSFVKTSDQS